MSTSCKALGKYMQQALSAVVLKGTYLELFSDKGSLVHCRLVFNVGQTQHCLHINKSEMISIAKEQIAEYLNIW